MQTNVKIKKSLFSRFIKKNIKTIQSLFNIEDTLINSDMGFVIHKVSLSIRQDSLAMSIACFLREPVLSSVTVKLHSLTAILSQHSKALSDLNQLYCVVVSVFTLNALGEYSPIIKNNLCL